jgi:hypothetical protein
MTTLISPLSDLDDVKLFPGASVDDVNVLQAVLNVSLPKEHVQVLSESDGIFANGGYMRLFSAKNSRCQDIASWNDANNWKFAWDGRCDKYICFGEDIFGNQYAYDRDELANGVSNVYCLDVSSMTPNLYEANFVDFFNNEFLRHAIDPFYSLLIAARKVFGDIEKEHVIYTISPLFGGVEDISNMRVINARVGMICSGDMAVGLDTGPEEGVVESVEPYEDIEGRLRLRLVWK